MTPTSWNYFIKAAVVLLWQATWICYAWSFLCRPNTMSTIPQSVYLLYTCAKLSIAIWTFLWLSFYPSVSFPFVLIAAVAISVAFRKHNVYFHQLSRQSEGPSKVDIWLTRTIVENGLALYATSLALDTLVVFGIIMQYYAGVSAIDTAVVFLSVMACALVVYSLAENTVLYKYFCHVYVVHPVVIWFLIGTLAGHWGIENEKTSASISLFVLLLAATLLVIKIVIVAILTFFYKGARKMCNTKKKSSSAEA